MLAPVVEPAPPPVTAAPQPVATADPPSAVVIQDIRPHWTRRALRYVQSSTGFGVSLVVHVALILLLGVLVFHEQIAAPFITLSATNGKAESDALVADTFELKPAEPQLEPHANDLGGMENFAKFSDVMPEPLGDLSSLGSVGVIEGELQDSLREGVGEGKFGGEGGLFDESFDGMIEYARTYGLDIVIAFDSTGSMGGEIAAVKDRIMTIGGSLVKKVPSTRISLVTYRDVGDEYVVKGTPLSNDLSAALKFLTNVRAAGGGDNPEAVDQGLEFAIKKNKFRLRARKVILVFGDAPPHQESVDKCVSLADEFHRYDKGVITMITVRNSESLPEFIQIAKAGGGSAFGMQDTGLLMEELLVQVFGEKHRHKALKFFGVAD